MNYAQPAPFEKPMVETSPLAYVAPWYLRVPPHMPGCTCAVCKKERGK